MLGLGLGANHKGNAGTESEGFGPPTKDPKLLGFLPNPPGPNLRPHTVLR